MYKTVDNDLRMGIRLEDIPMHLVMGGHSCSRIRKRSRGHGGVKEVFFRIALLLEQSEVAAHINDNVKVGDDCVIYDADTGFSFVLAIAADEVFVKTVYYPQHSCDTFAAAKGDFCLLVKQAEVLCADAYRNVQAAIDALAFSNMSRVTA